jgi:hypothetical protein
MALNSKNLFLAMGIILALIVIYLFSVLFNDHLPGNLVILVIALNFLLLVIVLTYLIPKEKILKDEIGMIAILGLTIIALFSMLNGDYQSEGEDGIVHIAIYGIVVILITEYIRGRWDKTATGSNGPGKDSQIESTKIQKYRVAALTILPIIVLILGFLLIYFNPNGLKSFFDTFNSYNSGISVIFIFTLIFLLLAMVMVYLVPKEKFLKDEIGMIGFLGLTVIVLFVLMSGGGQWIEIVSFAVGGIVGFLVRISLEKDGGKVATGNNTAVDHPDRNVQIEFLKTQRYGIMALAIFSMVALILGFLSIYYVPQKILVLTNGANSAEIISTSADFAGKMINVTAAALGGITGFIGGKMFR